MRLNTFDKNNTITSTIDYSTIPSHCPYCHTEVLFDEKFGIFNRTGYYYLVECPKCNSCSILHASDRSGYIYNITPDQNILIELPKHIRELSPRFCEIYSQTVKAEKLGLNELIGLGYSKSLECLVYDYLVKVQNISPVKNFAQNISKLENFNDATIQLTLAKFVRNDVVHPEKESDFDITDMKDSIECLITFFDAKYATFKLSQKLDKIEEK